MQNKKTLTVIVVIATLVLAGGGYYLFAGKSSKPADTAPSVQEEVVQTVTPGELGLETTLRDDKKAIKFVINKAKDISSVEYQISYAKEINGEQVPEGLIGQVDIKSTDEQIGINYREFGTCSSGKCRYDQVVSPVKLTLKVTKNDGKVYSCEKTIEL